MIKAIVFDLDDTLYPEEDYVKSGFKAVAKVVAESFGLFDAAVELQEIFDKNHNNVIDMFIKNHGLNTSVAAELVEVYREHQPDIRLSGEVMTVLKALRENGLKLGIITDGRPSGQRNKIAALGLENLVDKVIITDELGGIEYRKPNPKPFELMCNALDTAPEETVFVGDNPQKDFAVKKHLPITTVRRISQNAIYKDSDYRDNIRPDYIITSLSGMLDILKDFAITSVGK